MKLLKNNGFWIWEGGFESRHVPKAAKFRWNDNGHPKFKPNPDVPLKTWWTDDIEKASALMEFAEGDVLAELENHAKEVEERLAASSATDADIFIPAPSGFEYYGYQKAGISYGLKNRSVLIADEMGLGKTIQAIGIMNTDSTMNKILIVVPASLKLNWKKEIAVWGTRDLSVHIVTTKKDRHKMPDANVLIINYDILTKFDWLTKKVVTEKTVKGKTKSETTYEGVVNWDMVIADEAHYVKNHKAMRSKAFYGIVKNSDRKIMLTGTPILNRPIELFYIINSLGFDMNFWTYARRYCNAYKGRFGWDMSGASNLEELQMKLRQSVMIRRKKMDVLHELPPKRRQIIELDPEKYKDYIEAEQEFMDTHGEEFFHEDSSDDSEVINIADDYNAHVSGLKSFTPEHIAQMAKLRHATALAKVDDVVDHLNGLFEETDKVIVFAHHRDVIEAIGERFGDSAVTLYGGMKDTEKDSAVTQFQTDPSVKLFIGSISAAGVGLTLTQANVVVFAELDWVPANLSQAEDRAHRIGQTDSVLVQHIVIDGSMDSTLAKRVVGKQNMIDKAMNAEKVTEYRKKQVETISKAADQVNADIEAAKKKAERIAKDREEKKEAQKSRNAADGIREYSDAEKTVLLDRLRMLAGVCDFANTLDNRGFNGRDAAFGHSLAEKDTLSDRQAHYAEKMLVKYHRQIGNIKELLKKAS